MTVGDRIKQRRMELGLTQTELAEKMGYSGKSSVCAAETTGDNITTTKVEKFAKALDVSFRYLMGLEDENGNATPHGQLQQIYEDKLNNKVEKALELFNRIESLPPEKKQMLLNYLAFLQEGQELPHLKNNTDQ